jgi:maleylacetate reductase
LPHAETHAVILPHATAFNAQAVPDLLAPIAEIFGDEKPGLAIHGFAADIGAPMSLKDIGMQEADLDRVADLATQAPYWNPAPVSRDAVRALLQDAFDGRAPTS